MDISQFDLTQLDVTQMDLTTQLGVVSGLLGILVLLLAASIRRRRRAAAEADVQDGAAEQVEETAPDEPVDAATVESVAVGDADVEADVEADLEADLAADVELEGVTAEASPQEWEELEALGLPGLDDALRQAGATDEAALDGSTAEQAATYLRQVSLVVRGLAEHTSEDENPHRTLARVAAAVERLGAPVGIARPVLPLPTDPPPHPLGRIDRSPSHLRELPQAGPESLAQDTSFLTLPGQVPTEPVPPMQPVQPHAFQQPVPAQAAGYAMPPMPPVPDPLMDPLPEMPADSLTDTLTDLSDPTADTQYLAAAYAEEIVLPVPPPASATPPARRRLRR